MMATEVHDRATGYRDAAAPHWPDHEGRRDADTVYVVRPDPAIGEVISAWSNQRRSGFRPRDRSMTVRVVGFVILSSALVAFLGGLMVLALLALVHVRPDPVLVYPTIGVLAALALTPLVTQRPACNYLGKEGVHDHFETLFVRRDVVVRFADVERLDVTEQAASRDGQAVTYQLTFRGRRGEVVASIAGTRFDRGLWAHPSPHWVFAQAVIAHWAAWDRARRGRPAERARP
jgi:hypothetical protein